MGSTTDILTGVVIGMDDAPLAGAQVEATSVETQITKRQVTDARGRYSIVFPDGGGQYQLVVRYIGLAPQRFDVVRQADEDRFVTNVHMTAVPYTLPPVVARGRQPRGRDSCTGPWQGSLDFQMNYRPKLFGLDHRLTLSILTVNFLGGLDALLHGSANCTGGASRAPRIRHCSTCADSIRGRTVTGMPSTNGSEHPGPGR